MIILVDMDDVLANFGEAYRTAWLAEGHPWLEGERTQWDMKHAIPETHHHLIEELMCRPGFFRTLPVMQGAQEAIAQMASMGMDVVVCSTPPARAHHGASEKMAWLEEHFGHDMAKRAILTHDKTMVRGSVLIDDKPEIRGRYWPEWKHVVFDQPYNRHLPPGPRIKRWSEWQNILYWL